MEHRRREPPYLPAEIHPAEGRVPEKVTAGAFLVEEGRLLLEKRPADARVYPGCWDTPGGHVEPGETPERALVRELREELGVEALRFRLGTVQDDVERGTGIFYRHFVYLVHAWWGTPRSREGRTIRWFDLAAAAALSGLNPLAGWALHHFMHQGWIEGGPPR